MLQTGNKLGVFLGLPGAGTNPMMEVFRPRWQVSRVAGSDRAVRHVVDGAGPGDGDDALGDVRTGLTAHEPRREPVRAGGVRVLEVRLVDRVGRDGVEVVGVVRIDGRPRTVRVPGDVEVTRELRRRHVGVDVVPVDLDPDVLVLEADDAGVRTLRGCGLRDASGGDDAEDEQQ